MTVSIVRYGVQRLFVYEMTDNTVGAPVYDTGLRASCVRRVGYARRIVQAILEGDDSICVVTNEVKALDFALEFGGVPLDVQAMIQGATLVEDAGPPVTSHFVVSSADVPAQFGVIAKVAGKQGGSAHIAMFNCVEQGGGAEEAAQDTFGMTNYTGTAIPSPENELGLYGIKHFAATDQDIDTTWTNNDVSDPAP